MKKAVILILIFINLISCSKNNQVNFDTGNLWKITSKSGTESFIFSTIHLYPKDELDIAQEAISSLKKCNTLALEFNMLDSLELQKISTYKMPKSLSNGYSALLSEYDPKELSSMEIQLIEIAKKHELKIIGLESADEMLANLDKFKETEDSKKEMSNQLLIENFQMAFKMYREENIHGIKKNMSQDEPTMTEIIVDQRNKNWIEDIIKTIEKEKTFIAVGMAHFGGENGILNLLHKEGFKLERIKN
ncbi:TraB/GumN family protein [Christiangramia echinicola]|uniref:TraB/GumN family protein n=1 Tax=Christiangramia echinicola TaxID=279359 RepID=UPI00047DA01C|nr:TraB/GumN family protein [Christiangramia echinicola]